MCQRCNSSGSSNMCPICYKNLPCNTRNWYCVCSDCLMDNHPYDNNNNTIFYYIDRDTGKICFRNTNNCTDYFIRNKYEKICYIKGQQVKVLKKNKQMVEYQAF